MEIDGVETLSEPRVYRREQRARVGGPALAAQQATEAHGRPKLERPALLSASDLERATVEFSASDAAFVPSRRSRSSPFKPRELGVQYGV